LQECIEFIFAYENYVPDHQRERLFPDGSMTLLIDMDDTPKRLYHSLDSNDYTEFQGSWISGQQTGSLIIGAAHASMIVVRFHPGGAFPFLKLPMSELTGHVVPMTTLLGDLIADAREWILEADSLKGKLLRTEEFFRNRYRDSQNGTSVVRESVRQLSRPGIRPKVRELASSLGLSQKHLISLFNDHVGLSPKQFSRISRFQQAIAMMGLSGEVDLQNVIHECGYYDQAHFNHEFKEMTTMTPSVYLSSRSEYMNYIYID
jgi:AraC-like DNA-binding protein